MTTYVFDACALIAYFQDEIGGEKIEDILHKAGKSECEIFINKINVLEIYYDAFRVDGEQSVREMLSNILALPITIVDTIRDDVFMEAGRFKATHRISLADSIALAEAKTRNVPLVTTDHHEFDIIDKNGEVKFFWIR
jgi:PIN domain nuclease of toxin-antitoxin system